jgi:hypothetical protein
MAACTKKIAMPMNRIENRRKIFVIKIVPPEMSTYTLSPKT